LRRRRGVATLERVSIVALGTATDWFALRINFAVCVLSAHGADWQDTGILANILEAGIVGRGAVFGHAAFPLYARELGVADVAPGARTDGAFVALSVSAGVAVCPGSTGIVGTQVGVSEGAAGFEGVSRHVAGAGADGPVLLDFAVRVGPAGADARVDAGELRARLVGRAVGVGGALGVASRMGVSLEVLGAGAGHTVSRHLAVRILPASSVGTGVHAAVVLARLGTRAF